MSPFCPWASALVAGCLSGNPNYFPYSKPSDDGYFTGYDPYACRIELRPDVCTAPVRGTQAFIATVYDDEGVPRRKRRVEWMLEGPGNIIEVDENGIMRDHGMKVDNRFAFSFTNYLERRITRGTEEFTIGPGQTWCIVTSAVEGETTVIAYAPAIADWDKSRVYARLNWVDGQLRYPPPVTTRAGGEYTLGTRVKAGGANDYRIRYRIVDGPPAALASSRGARSIRLPKRSPTLARTAPPRFRSRSRPRPRGRTASPSRSSSRTATTLTNSRSYPREKQRLPGNQSTSV